MIVLFGSTIPEGSVCNYQFLQNRMMVRVVGFEPTRSPVPKTGGLPYGPHSDKFKNPLLYKMLVS